MNYITSNIWTYVYLTCHLFLLHEFSLPVSFKGIYLQEDNSRPLLRCNLRFCKNVQKQLYLNTIFISRVWFQLTKPLSNNLRHSKAIVA